MMRFLFAAAVSAFFLISGAAQAAPITYKFTAEVSELHNLTGSLSRVAIDTPLVGEFVYSTESTSLRRELRRTIYSGVPGEFAATLVGNAISFNLDRTSVYNGLNNDGVSLLGRSLDYSFEGRDYIWAEIRVVFGSDVNLWNAGNIPATLDLADYQGPSFVEIRARDLRLAYTDVIKAKITSLEPVSVVPLPASMPLLLAGICILGAVGCRKRA